MAKKSPAFSADLLDELMRATVLQSEGLLGVCRVSYAMVVLSFRLVIDV